jgi:hypothetical protein
MLGSTLKFSIAIVQKYLHST